MTLQNRAENLLQGKGTSVAQLSLRFYVTAEIKVSDETMKIIRMNAQRLCRIREISMGLLNGLKDDLLLSVGNSIVIAGWLINIHYMPLQNRFGQVIG